MPTKTDHLNRPAPIHPDHTITVAPPRTRKADVHDHQGTPLHVRIGIDDIEYRVGLLSCEGFSAVAAPPLPNGVITHVSLRLGYGVSVSVQATARTWNPDVAIQWYDFTNVDREVLTLLMLASAPASVH